MLKGLSITNLSQNKFIKNFSFVIIARFSNAFLFFIVSFLLMKFLSKEEYGQFNDFYASSAVLSFFVNLGIDRSFVAVTSKIKNKSLFLDYVGLFWKTKFIITSTFTSLSLLYYLYSQNTLFLLMILSGFFFGLSEGIKPVAEAQKKFNIVSLLVPVRNIILITFISTLLYLDSISYYNIIYALIIANILNLIVFIIAYLSNISNLTIKTNLPYSTLLGFAKWLFIKDFFIVFVANLEILIMGRMVDYGVLNANILGIYSGAFTLCRVLSVVTNSLTNVLLPEIAEKTSKEKLGGFLNKLTKSFVYTIILGIVFYVSMIFLVRLIFDEKYIESEPLFPLIILGTIFAFYANNISLIFYRQGGLEFIGKLTIFKLILGIILSLILIPSHGGWGAAISFLLVRLVDLAIVFLKAKRMLFTNNSKSHFE